MTKQELLKKIEAEKETAVHVAFMESQGFVYLTKTSKTEVFYNEKKKILIEQPIPGGKAKVMNIKFHQQHSPSDGMKVALNRIKILELNGNEYLNDYE